MNPEVVRAPNGSITMKLGDEWLDDPNDPVAAARRFVDQKEVEGVDWAILFGAGVGYRVARLSELGVKHVCVYDPIPGLLGAMSSELPQLFEGAILFDSAEALRQYLAEDIDMDERVRFFSTGAYQRLFKDEFERTKKLIEEAFEYARLERVTLRERAAMITEAGLRSFGAFTGSLRLTSIASPLKGLPAFIVGAGPSLDRNIHLANEVTKRGPVFVVNTASPAWVAQGAHIDVLASIEALPVADTLRSVASQCDFFALKLGAHPSSYEIEGPRKIIFHSDPLLDWPASLVDLPRWTNAGNVATAAFRLAYEWGADPIVLLGQDCAFTDGRLYASNCGRDGWSAEVQGASIHLSYHPSFGELFSEHGLPPPKTVNRVEMPAWGGGTVNTMVAFADTRRWFEDRARETKNQWRLINATEGGARIEGFEEQPLSRVLDELPATERVLRNRLDSATTYSEAEIKKAIGEMATHVKEVERAAEQCLRAPQGAKRDEAANELRQIARFAPIVNSHVTSALLKLRQESGLTPQHRARLTFEAIHNSARAVLAILKEENHSKKVR